MPLVDSNLAQTWDELYGCELSDGTLAHFERAAKERILGEDHWRLRNALGLLPGTSICIVGAGYGWIAEDWEEAGLGPIVCTDTSTYIHQGVALHAVKTILDEDALTAESRSRILAAAGLAHFDLVITEDVLPILSDEECLVLCSALRELGLSVAHWISVGGGDPRLNWKTPEAWRALTGDLIVPRGSGQVY